MNSKAITSDHEALLLAIWHFGLQHKHSVLGLLVRNGNVLCS